MLPRPRRQLEVLSISALDLFASALGVFILMAVILFPFYLKKPSVDAALEGAQAKLAGAAQALAEAERRAREEAEAKARSEKARDQAEAGLRLAQAALAKATEAERLALGRAREAAVRKGVARRQMGNFAMADLDLVFVMDTTGSMADEIRDVQRNLLGIIRLLHRMAPSLHVGFVAFKDRTDPYLVRSFPLVPMRGANLAAIRDFVGRLSAKGGGDYPEAVGEALREGIAMDWRPDAEGRIVIIGDAPAHAADWTAAFEQAAAFRESPKEAGVTRRVSAIFTGKQEVGRRFFEKMAEAGGGDFVSHRGRIMESVLLSVLGARRASR